MQQKIKCHHCKHKVGEIDHHTLMASKDNTSILLPNLHNTIILCRHCKNLKQYQNLQATQFNFFLGET